MKFHRVFFAALIVVMAIPAAFAQPYPLPRSVNQTQAICTGCPGTNFWGEPNDGLPVASYGAPLTAHVGRLVDSSNTGNVIAGFRTARAGAIRMAPSQRGGAPPRAYIQIGEAMGAYSLSTFFSSKLPAGMTTVASIPGVGSLFRTPERITMFDAFVYPEFSGSGWSTTGDDGQDRLYDFDYDDRGYVYLAYYKFGWGIVLDDGSTGAKQLPKQSQRTNDPVVPQTIFTIKSGGKYYAAVSARQLAPSNGPSEHLLYDVTDPKNPGTPVSRVGTQWGISRWAKYEPSGRIATITGDYRVRVFNYANFVAGSSPVVEYTPSSGKYFVDVSFDEAGTLWIAESPGITKVETNVLLRATPSGGSYVLDVLSPYGTGKFSPDRIDAAAGFVVLSGRGDRDGTNGLEVRVLKLENGEPRLVDDGGFFKRFYSRSLKGWAMPAGYTSINRGINVFSYNGKTYLIHSVHGLGDVFELSGDPPPPCTSFNITPTSVNSLSGSASQLVSVIGSPAGCTGGSWSTSSSASWIQVSPSSGSGSGSATVSWSQNTGDNRSGTATIAGSTFTVTQKNAAESACTSFSISPTSASPGSTAGSQSVTVAGSPLGCIGGSWSTSTSAEWLSVGSGGNGSGSTTVSWTSNTGLSSRSATATIAGKTFSVNQASVSSCAGLPLEGNMTFSSSCSTGCAIGAAIQFTPSIFGYTLQSCDTVTWNFGDNTGNVIGSPGASHAFNSGGNFTVRMTVSNSNGSAFTTRTINVAGGNPGPTTCTSFNISPSSHTAGSTSGSRSVSITGSPSGCTGGNWTTSTNASWLTVSPSSGTGGGSTTVSWTANTGGSSRNATATIAGKSFSVAQGVTSTPDCDGLPLEGNITFTPSCSTGCQTGQTIHFTPSIFGYTLKDCDTISWDFGDDSPVQTGTSATHSYSQGGTFVAKMTISNTSGSVSATQNVNVVGTTPVKPLPVLTFSGFPSKGAKGVSISFTATSNMATTTGWSWNFGDGTTDNSQAGVTSQSNSRSHTFAGAGNYTVTVSARNSEDVPTAQSGIVSATITIDDVTEYKYLLPATIHQEGVGGSLWRTDVQIYNPDPNVSASNPLKMTVKFKPPDSRPEVTKELEVEDSTYIYEDFLTELVEGEAQGPVFITAKGQFAPQIWTRTYNQTPEGTFGQFIPAVRIDAGGGSSFGQGKYYLAGLRQNGRYRTNIGLMNPNASAMTVVVKVFDELKQPIGSAFTRQVQAFHLDQFPLAQIPELKNHLAGERPFSIEFDVSAGLWAIGYASLIDSGSNDPVFIRAVRESDLESDDFRKIVVPGVGHVGAWRSDVTIFNPDTAGPTVVHLAYHDQDGVKVGEARNILIGEGGFQHFNDLLKEGIFGSLPDSLGILYIEVPATVTPARFPMAGARTYNDNGSGKTYGQGISGFALNRANVKPGKPGIIPSVRSDEGYYTNVGLINLAAVPSRVRVYLLDQVTGSTGAYEEYLLQPNQSIVRSRIDGKDLIKSLNSSATRGTLKVELVSGGNVWAFASVIDEQTKDPEYVAAIATP